MTDFSMFKLGARFHTDKRTIQLSDILLQLPSYPASYDVDSAYPNLTDSFMFKNDTLGDCVIAGRAHHTLRFEDYEQKTVIPISDTDVTTEYFKETGGSDSGLDMINSLNAWRKGWKAAGQTYDIYAYAQVTPTNKNEVMAAMYLLNGLYIGVNLPISAQTQDVWDVASGPNGQPGSWGGHCIYLVAYDDKYLTCITWGMRKKMTWAFFTTYCDQAFAIVDDKDSWVVADVLDVTALNQILALITGEPVPSPTPPTPVPPVTNATINISVSPSNAVVTISGQVVPLSFTINPGTYTLVCSCKGYKSAQRTQTVQAGQIYPFVFTLSKSGLCIFN